MYNYSGKENYLQATVRKKISITAAQKNKHTTKSNSNNSYGNSPRKIQNS